MDQLTQIAALFREWLSVVFLENQRTHVKSSL